MIIKKRNGLLKLDTEEASARENAFILEFTKDWNGTKAAIRAGYAESSAAVVACYLLKKPHIIEAINDYTNNLANKFIVDKENILKELSFIGNSDIVNYIDIIDGVTYLKGNISDLPSHITKAIKKIKGVKKVKHTVTSKGTETEEEAYLTEVELYDKLSALEKMGKEIGMFREKVELSGVGGAPLFPVKLVMDFGDGKEIEVGKES